MPIYIYIYSNGYRPKYIYIKKIMVMGQAVDSPQWAKEIRETNEKAQLRQQQKKSEEAYGFKLGHSLVL